MSCVNGFGIVLLPSSTFETLIKRGYSLSQKSSKFLNFWGDGTDFIASSFLGKGI